MTEEDEKGNGQIVKILMGIDKKMKRPLGW